MHYFAAAAGDTRQSSFGVNCCDVTSHNGDMAPPSNETANTAGRQSRVIQVAEQFLQKYYTRLSTDPHSMSGLYLENAEVIYTGKELTVDAIYACGRLEVDDFFSSEPANKFRGARVVVDALHPQASPTSFFGVSLFAKGRLFLNGSAGGPATGNPQHFVETPYVHFVSLAPPPKPAGSWGEFPTLYIANEYFHLLNLNLSPALARRPSIDNSSGQDAMQSTAPLTQPSNCGVAVPPPVAPNPQPRLQPQARRDCTASARDVSETLVNNAAHPLAPPTSAQPPQAQQQQLSKTGSAIGYAASRWGQDTMSTARGSQQLPPRSSGENSNDAQNSSVALAQANGSAHQTQTTLPSSQPMAQQSSRCTVHAHPGFSVDTPDEEIVTAITECIKVIGPGSCVSISKPRPQPAAVGSPAEYGFFFIHCDCPETAQLLLNIKTINVLGQDLRLSPQRPSAVGQQRYGGAYRQSGGSRNLNSNRRPHLDSRPENGPVGLSSDSRPTVSETASQQQYGGPDTGERHHSLQRMPRGSSSSRGPSSHWVRRGGGGAIRGGNSLRGHMSTATNRGNLSSPVRKSVLVKGDSASRVSTSGDGAAAPASPRNPKN
eukprot:Blabericola_migrator_1__11910@NODE_726_length_6713_cov_131_507824_g522_i0_p1_GENE_NODE_726_length_6713_cov_131_507824_g522_i0NODE_726_length_6713_cov_131_507824_g522_i0_p1_ORF_typecomplete_len602_score81_50NTF2/PF02136_20/0_00019_NODE_726_length_6713_cov_131_507824_g522_i020863891